MKKLVVVALSLCVLCAISACGTGGDAGSADAYNLDKASTTIQEMSSDRASKEVLYETSQTFFDGNNMFSGTSQADLTYDDVVEHIGVDPSEYRFDENMDAELYSWYAQESDTSVLNVWFKDGKIYAQGAYNLR